MLTQKEIAKKAKTSQQYISLILNGKRRPSWRTAKRLAAATNTTPYIWLEGTREDIIKAVNSKDESEAA